MPRFLSRLLPLVATLFVALATPSSARAEVIGRDLAGAPVEIGTRPTVLVFWNTGCDACVAAIGEAEALGLHVIAVSTDSAAARSTLTPRLHAAGVTATVMADPEGTLHRRYRLASSTSLALLDRGTVVALARPDVPALRVSVQRALATR